jgi:hypothetical protein
MTCRYNAAVEEKVKVMRERDEARDAASALHSERDSAAREKMSVGAGRGLSRSYNAVS